MNLLNSSNWVSRSLIGAVGLSVSAIALLGSPDSAKAANVIAGADYFISPEGFSTLLLNGEPIAVKGKPLEIEGLGLTDTKVIRKEDAIFDTDGDGILDIKTVTIPIEMVELSLENVDPVLINGFNYDLMIGLDPNNPTNGEMTITHKGKVGEPFDDSGYYQGTYTSFLDVFYEVEFTPIDGGPQIPNVFDNLRLDQPPEESRVAPAKWSHKPSDDAVIVRNSGDPLMDNCHTSSGPCAPGDFFAGLRTDGKAAVVLHQKGSPLYPNGHGTITTTIPPREPIVEKVPEPSATIPLALLGLAGIWGVKKKQSLK